MSYNGKATICLCEPTARLELFIYLFYIFFFFITVFKNNVYFTTLKDNTSATKNKK